MIKNLLILTSLFILTLSVKGDEGLTIVAVGKADIEKDGLIVATADLSGSMTRSEKAMVSEYEKLVKNDFSFYKQKFNVLGTNEYGMKAANKDYSFLSGVGIRYFILNSFEKSGVNRLNVKSELYGVREKSLLETISTSFSSADLRKRAHEANDVLYQKITGQTSIFRSRIVFVSDKGTTRIKGIKELYVMDFDGSGVRKLTNHRGNVISPAFSFDGSKVLYSLIKNSRSKNRNINLYVLDLNTGKSRVVSSKKGINSGAFFMPDGENIALTMTHQGNAEIYALNLNSGKTRRITKHYQPDVDPSINVTGSKMAFLSGRSGAGKPMIYIADPRGLERGVKRISYVGKFNATPRFSPDGSEIAFASWLDNRFDIFRVDENGANLHRLTKDFGSNEDPTYSNDGQFIAFSSQRVLSRSKAVQNIYIMTRDGEILGQVTKKLGNCSTPRWSKY
jgi:TolB protein